MCIVCASCHLCHSVLSPVHVYHVVQSSLRAHVRSIHWCAPCPQRYNFRTVCDQRSPHLLTLGMYAHEGYITYFVCVGVRVCWCALSLLASFDIFSPTCNVIHSIGIQLCILRVVKAFYMKHTSVLNQQ